MEAPLLLQPPTSNSSSAVLARLFLLLFLLSAALYADREASKSFEIVVVTPAAADRSAAAKRFRVSFVSNGLATRLVLGAANHIDQVLHSHHPHNKNIKKRIQQVTLQLATHNLTRPVMVAPGSEPDSYVVSLSPTLLLVQDAGERVKLAVRRGMARVLIWDGKGTAPMELIEAMAEALSGSDSGRDPVQPVGPCWLDAGFLKYCEERRGGFLGRLNEELKTGWREDAVAKAVGMPTEKICGTYRSMSALGLDQVM